MDPRLGTTAMRLLLRDMVDAHQINILKQLCA